MGIGFFFVLVIAIESFSPFGGAHFNPVVSLVMFLNRDIPFLLMLLYAFTQCLASAIAAYCMKLFLPEADKNHYAITTVNPVFKGQIWKPLVIEIILTFILL